MPVNTALNLDQHTNEKPTGLADRAQFFFTFFPCGFWVTLGSCFIVGMAKKKKKKGYK
jgi:hypothetical protein